MRAIRRVGAAFNRGSGVLPFLSPAQGATDDELVELAARPHLDRAEEHRARVLLYLYDVARRK